MFLIFSPHLSTPPPPGEGEFSAKYIVHPSCKIKFLDGMFHTQNTEFSWLTPAILILTTLLSTLPRFLTIICCFPIKNAGFKTIFYV